MSRAGPLIATMVGLDQAMPITGLARITMGIRMRSHAEAGRVQRFGGAADTSTSKCGVGSLTSNCPVVLAFVPPK